MRFTEAKKKKPLFLLVLILIVIIISILGLCHFEPTPQIVQKTIVFQAD